MKRISIIAAVLAVALVGAGALASAAVAPSRARLSDFACHRALAPLGRSTSITAVMRPVTGTEKMEMEIELFSRAAGGATFASVSIPAQSKLDTWITAPGTLGQRPGDIWKVKVPVAGLDVAATYRYQVQFRWVGRDGKVLATTQRTSANCYQRDLRPVLAVSSFTAATISGRPKLDRYVAVIGNTGDTAARNFQVELSDGGTVETRAVAHLHAHSAKTVTFIGPLCEASAPPSLTVDPQHAVDSANAGPVTATATCPGPPDPTVTTAASSG